VSTNPPPNVQRLILPSGFPDALFETISQRLAAKIHPSAQAPSAAQWDHVGGGQNGVRYRLRACADYCKEFTNSVRDLGDAPVPEDRYLQERQLFGFFVSGLAAVDSFSYLLYFAAAYLQPTAFFLTTTPRKISLDSTAEAFSKHFPLETVTASLNNLLDDPRFVEWKNARNVLAHRAAPGRVIYAFDTAAADWKMPGLNAKIDDQLMPPRLDWLVGTLAQLVADTDDFTKKYF